MLCLVGKKLEEKKRTKRKKSLQVKLKLHSSQSLIPRSGFFSSAKSFLGNQTEPINSKRKGSITMRSRTQIKKKK